MSQLNNLTLSESSLGLQGEPDFIKFSRYLTLSLSVYNVGVPLFFLSAIFLGIVSNLSATITTI